MNIKSAKELVSAANTDVVTLSANEAVKLIHDPNVVFVDVREADERRKTGALKGPVYVPRGFLGFHADPNSPTHVKALSSGKRLVLHCASGNRSALSAKTLKSMGIPASRMWSAAFRRCKRPAAKPKAPRETDHDYQQQSSQKDTEQ